MSDQKQTQEELILQAVKIALTTVVKETATAPGLKHPLSDETLIGIRDCLGMISHREQELAQEHGRDMSKRPRYVDEVVNKEVVVSIDSLVKSKEKSDD